MCDDELIKIKRLITRREELKLRLINPFIRKEMLRHELREVLIQILEIGELLKLQPSYLLCEMKLSKLNF